MDLIYKKFKIILIGYTHDILNKRARRGSVELTLPKILDSIDKLRPTKPEKRYKIYFDSRYKKQVDVLEN